MAIVTGDYVQHPVPVSLSCLEFRAGLSKAYELSATLSCRMDLSRLVYIGMFHQPTVFHHGRLCIDVDL
jgi:hypothetical protein